MSRAEGRWYPGPGCGLLALGWIAIPLVFGGATAGEVVVLPCRFALAFPALAAWLLFLLISHASESD